MASVAVQPFTGIYSIQRVPSSFAFAVRHSGVFWYRGSLSDVAGTLRGTGDALALEGSARVDSISVVEPAAMRASVLGPDFFDAERHPEVTMRRRDLPPSVRSRDYGSRRASTAADSDCTGRWSSRAVATRSAGTYGWRSIYCSSEKTQLAAVDRHERGAQGPGRPGGPKFAAQFPSPGAPQRT